MYKFLFDLCQFEETPEEKAARELKEKEVAAAKALLENPVVVAAINAAREAARVDEKDKVYQTINHLKDSVDKLNNTNLEREKAQKKAEKEAQELADKAAKERMAAMSAEERYTELTRQSTQQLQELQEANKRLAEETRAELAAAKAEAAKEKLLRASKIPEEFADLVMGNTEDEIKASIARLQTSINAFSDKVKAEKIETNPVDKRFGHPPAELERPALDPDTGKVTPSGDVDTTLAAVLKGTAADYQKNRDAEMAAASAAAKQARALQ
jgi:hypothetical protein